MTRIFKKWGAVRWWIRTFSVKHFKPASGMLGSKWSAAEDPLGLLGLVMTEVCVRVAVRVRPLLPKEVLRHHEVCVRVVPGSAQVMFGSDRLFSFDHAFGPTASQDEVYESVRPLVESLLDGNNATVFCYGQTGSGKTFTLEGENQGAVWSQTYFIRDLGKLFDSVDI